MPVTKQTYKILPVWTAADLANSYRSAFIDAGLMTDWHDSFSSGGIENRVLRIQYNPAKAYGTTFYWFMFTTSGAFLNLATGWNTSTKVPTGTQYLDFFSTATNTTGGHWQFSGGLTANTETNIIRYSSGTHHWFVSRQGTTRFCFTIQPASHVVQPWLDLDRGFYAGWVGVNTIATSWPAILSFTRGPSLRREIIQGPALRGSTGVGDYIGTVQGGRSNLLSYSAVGFSNNNWAGNFGGYWRSDGFGLCSNSILLPAGFTSANPAYPTNSAPVFHSIQFTPYSSTATNSDFGITFHYATNVFGFQDKFIVTPGVEEWEVLAFSNSPIGDGTAPSAAFLARVI